ncbi:hypothetical protein KAR91_02565 [Candidatus Pacearchaeota archaeon]|nr:hypothetical protein [Candidatus Pacearchaeota archaeon]
MRIWGCKIGGVDESKLSEGADAPMRKAVRKAYLELTGEEDAFCFAGWGAELDPIEQEILDGDSKKESTDVSPICEHGNKLLGENGHLRFPACGCDPEKLGVVEDLEAEAAEFDALTTMVRAGVAILMEPVNDLLYRDPHSWSDRPCQTCSCITSLIGADFGCVRYAAAMKESGSKH